MRRKLLLLVSLSCLAAVSASADITISAPPSIQLGVPYTVAYAVTNNATSPHISFPQPTIVLLEAQASVGSAIAFSPAPCTQVPFGAGSSGYECNFGFMQPGQTMVENITWLVPASTSNQNVTAVQHFAFTFGVVDGQSASLRIPVTIAPVPAIAPAVLVLLVAVIGAGGALALKD